MVRLRIALAGAALLAGTVWFMQAEAQTSAPVAGSPQVTPQPGSAPGASSQPMRGQAPPNIVPSSVPRSAAPPPTMRPGSNAVAQPATSPNTAAQPAPPAMSTGSGTARSASSRKRGHKTPIAEAPQTPPPPPTLEQSPPTAPKVSLQNGQLFIDAHNSTLTQVLRAVQSQTGASMEIPGSASSERVVAQLGPGQPSDVLRSLLNGSRFDYVILGVNGSPGAVQKVILTPRQGSSASAPMTAQTNVPGAQPAEEPQDEGVPVADNGDQDYQNQYPEQQPVPPPPGGFRRPMIQPPPQQDPGTFSGGEQQSGTKTPEQLMQELQQMQQQQQMYQQQLNPANQYPQQQ